MHSCLKRKLQVGHYDDVIYLLKMIVLSHGSFTIFCLNVHNWKWFWILPKNSRVKVTPISIVTQGPIVLFLFSYKTVRMWTFTSWSMSRKKNFLKKYFGIAICQIYIQVVVYIQVCSHHDYSRHVKNFNLLFEFLKTTIKCLKERKKCYISNMVANI